MNVSILSVNAGEAITDARETTDVMRITRLLDEHGYEVTRAVFEACREKIYKAFRFAAEEGDAVLVCGDTDLFFSALSDKYDLNRSMNTFMLDETPVALSDRCDDAFVTETLIPMLNSRCRTYYASAIFRTMEKTEDRLREILKEYLKNRNRIVFKFYPVGNGCDVHIRFSTKTQKPVVDAVIGEVTSLLADCTYALKDVPLVRQTADLLLLRGKRLALAESFTGGGIASALVSVPGISGVLTESVVCYGNRSKIDRLHVDPNIIERYGAVSIETVYEMAASLLMENRCDVAVATSGNAGPTSEKPDENGVCFIAVGNARGIHIYRYKFDGDRNQVIAAGVQTALFRLYKLLSQNEFEELLKEKEEIGTF